MWATRGKTRQVEQVLPGAGGERACGNGAEQDGEGDGGQGDGGGDDGGKSLIAPPIHGFFLQLQRCIFFFELGQSACPVQPELFSLGSIILFREVQSEIQNLLLLLWREPSH